MNDPHPPPRQRPRPRPRITVRQLLLTIAGLALVNALGAHLDRPLASGPGEAREEGQAYFADAQIARHRDRVASRQVVALRLVTILVGSTFVLSILGFVVFVNYLEAIRESRGGPPPDGPDRLPPAPDRPGEPNARPPSA
ncbi:hypothetical protein [Tautonia plasticadhaerens]|uniref:Uncharacterized protein n=1 Tax=Tautonia plasticadhaerens TaxID=2527974 RepID=A0A518H5N9_9BACT|nr:hypothetical protein [Tautonia plasticadhaerens]QDV36128.1 hypothetical protein ElP_40420 [Tautonia plasticadhaerens]